MGTDLFISDVQVLHSWKQIASYTGRGIRTLQRYEGLGFPIRRPLGKPRSSVLAFKHEIDRWFAETPLNSLPVTNGDSAPAAMTSLRSAARPIDELYNSAERWRRKTSSMQHGFTSMQESVNSMLERLHSMQQSLQRTKELMEQSKMRWQQTLIRRQGRASARVLLERGVLQSASAAAK